MSHAPITSRLTARWLACAVALSAAAPAAASAADWRLEPIGASEGVPKLHDLVFDAQGRALLSWDGARGPRPAGLRRAGHARPGGRLARPPDLAAIVPATAQIHLSGAVSALLVAREAASAGRRRGWSPPRASPTAASGVRVARRVRLRPLVGGQPRGRRDRRLDRERSPFVAVTERKAGHRFAAPRDLAIGKTGRRRDQRPRRPVLAWPQARAWPRASGRPAEGGATQRFGACGRSGAAPVGARRAQRGRCSSRGAATAATAAWPCATPAARGARGALELRCGPAAVGVRGAPVVPVADT